MARWPACSAMSRCISWPICRYDGWPDGAVRSSSMCIASRALICIVKRMPYASDTAYGACSGNGSSSASYSAAERSIASSNRIAQSGFVDGLGDLVPVARRQRLPLDREHAVSLQIAERAVVGDDVEAVVDAFERAPGLVATVAPLPHVRAQQRDAVVGAERAHLGQHLVFGKVRLRVADGREELVLGLGIEVGEGDGRARFGPLTCEDALHEVAGVVAGLGQVGAPRDPAVFAGRRG